MLVGIPTLIVSERRPSLVYDNQIIEIFMAGDEDKLSWVQGFPSISGKLE